MKVLWFTNTGSNFLNNDSHNGGGWISSLETILVKNLDISLSIAFNISTKHDKTVRENVCYYPIYKSRIPSISPSDDVKKYIAIVNECDPDIIHIFGTEQNFGLIIPHINKPVVIHLQGILKPYLNALLPPRFSKLDFFFQNGFNPFNLLLNYYRYKSWESRSDREVNILKNCKYIMGRTEWDRNMSRLLAPNSQYFYCSEILRSIFYKDDRWKRNAKSKKTIVSTLSSPLYKGADLILNTAKILKEILGLDFEWIVFGVNDVKYIEKKLKIKAKDVNVNFYGVVNSENLKINLLECDVFVHPSYIDNSPNSVCEAQILGVPVIACNVGGLSTIINHNETGLLVPANDPYMLAINIFDILGNKAEAERISNNEINVSVSRHNPKKITQDLIGIYETILKKTK